MKNQTIASVVALATIIFGIQFSIIQSKKITMLEEQLKLAEKAKEIEADLVRDLMYQLNNIRTEDSFKSTKDYVSGVVSAINKPDVYNDLWHDGYNRGTSVQQYADELGVSGKVNYTTKKQD